MDTSTIYDIPSKTSTVYDFREKLSRGQKSSHDKNWNFEYSRVDTVTALILSEASKTYLSKNFAYYPFLKVVSCPIPVKLS